jgi:hypothetical protein
MKLRIVSILLVCGISAILDPRPAAAGAVPAGPQAFAERAAGQPLLQRTSGCGWDYPCPPEPEFGRPAFRSDRVTIRNNYGPVNVYPGFSRRSYLPPPEEPAYCLDDPCRYGCGGYPCTEKCGTLCWIRRLRKGYCGHGCESYLEQAHTEAEERAAWKEEQAWKKMHKDDWMYEKRLECAPPACVPDYGAPPPPPPPYYYDRPPARASRRPSRPPRRNPPAKPDLTPRKRFQGPQYPAK